MMNLLVTGSSGFIGSHLCDYLKSLNEYKVFMCDRIIGFEVLDITKEFLISNNIDIVIHLAAQTSVWNENHELIVNDNITSFIYIFNLCKNLNIKFIYASSSCSINATSMYGLSKQLTDKYTNIYEYEKCIGLRLHNVYGPSPRKDTLLGKCLDNNIVFLYNDGKNYRHFTYIEDVCKAIEKSFKYPKGIYNVYNPEENSTEEFVNEVIKNVYYKHTLKIVNVHNRREYDKDYQNIDNSLENLINDSYTNIEKGIKISI